jgi:hypothetical protein
MGLERTRWLNIIFASPAERWHRARAKQQGCTVSLEGAFQKHSDILQLPGAALVAKGGEILWLHRGASTGDLPTANDLLAAVQPLL